MIGHTVQIPQLGTYGSQRVQQTQNTMYTNNYSNIEEVSLFKLNNSYLCNRKRYNGSFFILRTLKSILLSTACFVKYLSDNPLPNDISAKRMSSSRAVPIKARLLHLKCSRNRATQSWWKDRTPRFPLKCQRLRTLE